jgi:hypothetical protein
VEVPAPKTSEEPTLPADVLARCKRHSFQLEAGKSIDVRFVARRPPDATAASSTVAVVNNIGEKSPLQTNLAGQPGLAPGDVILEVNGQRGYSTNVLDVISALRNSGGRMDLEVCSRPRQFTVEVKKSDSTVKMGIVVAVHDEISDRVEVRNVADEGAVSDWNKDNPFNHVSVGDWVTKVAGVGSSGSAEAKYMIEDMQKVWAGNNTLKLWITPGNAI